MEKEKTIKPKIYSLLLESRDTTVLSMQKAYSLEEAFMLAKLEFENQNPAQVGILNPLIGAKIGLFTIKSIDDLLSDKPALDISKPNDELEAALLNLKNIPKRLAVTSPVNETPVPIKKTPKPTPAEQKNLLMRMIIENNNRSLFENNLKMFSKSEKAYINSKLK